MIRSLPSICKNGRHTKLKHLIEIYIVGKGLACIQVDDFAHESAQVYHEPISSTETSIRRISIDH